MAKLNGVDISGWNAGGFVFSLLTSLAGLPEVDETPTPRGKHNA